MSNNEVVYALYALCSGGCMRKSLGPLRKASDPDGPMYPQEIQVGQRVLEGVTW